MIWFSSVDSLQVELSFNCQASIVENCYFKISLSYIFRQIFL